MAKAYFAIKADKRKADESGLHRIVIAANNRASFDAIIGRTGGRC